MAEEVTVATLEELALRTYRKSRDCSRKEFTAFAPKTRTLSNTLQDFGDYLASRTIADGLGEQLQALLSLARSALLDISIFVDNYNNLSPAAQRDWDGFNWQDGHLREDVRARLDEVVDKLNKLYRELTQSTETKLAKALDQLVKEEKKSKRLQEAATGGVKGAWGEVVGELESMGIRRDTANSYRAFVVEWTRKQAQAIVQQRAEDNPGATTREEKNNHVQNVEMGPGSPKDSTERVVYSEGLVQNGLLATSSILEQSALPVSQDSSSPVEAILDSPSTVQTGFTGPRSESSSVITTPDGSSIRGNRKETAIFTSSQQSDGADAPEVCIYPQFEMSPLTPALNNGALMPLGHRSPVKMSIGRNSFVEDSPGRRSIPQAISIKSPRRSFREEEDTEKEIAEFGPPVPPKIPSQRPVSEVLPPTTSHMRSNSTSRSRSLSHSISREDLVSSFMDDRPPSPLPVDMCEIASDIIKAWDSQDWSGARRSIQEQIDSVENGQCIEVDGVSTQPDIRLLRHLQGICYSYEGNFVDASTMFQRVIRNGIIIDDADIAASRWLGNTCILLNEPQNAAMAWSVSLAGLMNHRGREHPMASQLVDHLRLLNQYTSGLSVLKTYGSNQDVSTILMQISAPTKFNLVLNALGFCYRGFPPATSPKPTAEPSSLKLSEGFLIQPLVAQQSFPIPFDHFFRTNSAISLLFVLTRPKANINPKGIPRVRLGKSKSLAFKTERGCEWLINGVREALNTYQLEWKIVGSSYLIRLAHTYNRISYYECYAVKFYKLSMRNTYGIKVTHTSYMSRTFVQSDKPGNPLLEFDVERQSEVIAELTDRIKTFLEERQRPEVKGQPPLPEPDVPELSAEETRFELAAPSNLPPETMATTQQLPAELDGKRTRFWRKNSPSEVPEGIFELPA